MRKIIIASLALLFAGSLKAQEVPGYLGKRWAFTYDMALMPTFFNPNSSGYVNEGESYAFADVPFSVSFKHYLNAEYAFSKKSSVKAGIGFFNSVYGNNLNFRDFFFGGGQPPYLTDLGSLNNLNLHVSIKSYREHYAPLGAYFEFKLGLEMVNYGDLEINLPATPGAEATRQIAGGSATGLAAYLGWGNTRVINDQWFLLYGIEFGYMYPSGTSNNLFTSAFDGGETIFLDASEASEASIQASMEESALGRVFSQALVNFRIGVGILQ